MSIKQLPTLGVGFGFRPPYLGDLFLHREDVDFLEITIEHYLDASPEKQRELAMLRDHFTLIPHGLNLSLGSAEGIDPRYVERVARLIEPLAPPWWSEHLSFTRADGVDIGHLSPLPFTEEAIEIFCKNIEATRKIIGIPLIVENITYMLKMPFATLNEAEFLRILLEEADCGLLLDVTNLYTNATNHHFDPIAFLEKLPPERITQLHFVGGHWQGERLIDSHSAETPEEIWTLLDQTLARFPLKGMILERDDKLPPFEEIRQELQRARKLGQKHQRWGRPT